MVSLSWCGAYADKSHRCQAYLHKKVAGIFGQVDEGGGAACACQFLKFLLPGHPERWVHLLHRRPQSLWRSHIMLHTVWSNERPCRYEELAI